MFPNRDIARPAMARGRSFARRLAALGVALAAVAGVVLIAGCACYGHRVHRPGEHATIALGEDTLHVVEADDEGWFWEPAQATQALAEIDASLAQHDTFVLVFVHGWHHGAGCCDGNLEGFKSVIHDLRGELSGDMYRSARAQLHGGERPFRLIGVYVGWRGRSLPGIADYATFWGRKAAAERVGAGDLREFMQRLARRYDDQALRLARARAAHDASANLPFFGLVTIGHSFGGQVVLNAVSSLLESRLVEAGAPPAWLRDSREPAQTEAPGTMVGGFGDLVVLVNPAVEASAYQRLHALGMGMRWDARQTPLVLTLSANDDKPRSRYFPLGRRAGEIFGRKPYKDDPFERESERAALGFFAPQRTHCLAALDQTLRLAPVTVTRDAEPECTGASQSCQFEKFDWRAPPSRHEPDSLSSASYDTATLRRIDCHDLSGRTVFGDVALQPEVSARPNQGLIVAAAHESVITTHNGMFSKPLNTFLVRYVGFIEAKRFMPLVLPDRQCPAHEPGEENAHADFCKDVD